MVARWSPKSGLNGLDNRNLCQSKGKASRVLLPNKFHGRGLLDHKTTLVTSFGFTTVTVLLELREMPEELENISYHILINDEGVTEHNS